MGPREFILIGPVPGMIVGVTLLGAWTIFNRGKRRGRGPLWVAPVVFALGFLPAFLANNSIARVWPRDGSYRFPHVALAAMLAGLGCVLIHKPAFVRHVISASALGFCVWVVIGSMPAVSLARADLVVWIVAVGIGGSAVVALTDWAGSLQPAWVLPTQLVFVALATSLICLYSSIAILSQHAGGVVAMATAAAIVGAIHKGMSISRGGTLVLYSLLAALCVGATQHTSYPVHLSAYVLVLIAPLGSLVAVIPSVRRGQSWKATALALAGVLIPLIAAVGIALLTRHVSEPYDG